ncbi:MAG TPA: exopolysaccharide biosynthesis polyprenyl glycosylphosphotransferase [Thermoanaerobaculia bacterium]|nr:exopolysaccharide biosynthesis polyprenyl glycosylphosphotransferase [Thermoanaerobaculia bacterium]
MRPSWGGSRAYRWLRLAGDVALAPAALGLAFLVRIHLPVPFTAARLPWDRLRFFAGSWPAGVAAQLASLYFLGFYDPPRQRSRPELARRLAGATFLCGLALMGYYFLANRAFPRSVLLLFVLLDFLLLLAWRLALDRPDRRHARRVAIVGSGEAAREVAAAIAAHWHGLAVAGFVPVPGEAAPDLETPDPVLGPCLGRPEDLPGLLAAGAVDDIILASPADSWQTRLIDGLAGSRPDHTNVLLLPGPFESLIGRMRYRSLHDLPLIEVVRESEWRINRPAKRLLDVALGALLLVFSLPLLLAAALAVRLTSPGPILYRQLRIGRDRRPFTLWKLRTMRRDAEASGDEVLAQEGDPRLTAAGALLRRMRLDEIPQLWNVLGGSMSLVGPRPERPGFVQRHLEEVPGYAERFSLAPGLTGLAQVNGDYHSSPQNKLRYELAYMGNWSLGLDLAILVRTVKIVLTSRGV